MKQNYFYKNNSYYTNLTKLSGLFDSSGIYCSLSCGFFKTKSTNKGIKKNNLIFKDNTHKILYIIYLYFILFTNSSFNTHIIISSHFIC